jgi:LysM repeat protein
MPDIPRVALLAGALGIAALALFFLPALLGIGDDGGAGPSASPSASAAVATASPSPTTPPAPTPQVYVVVGGDTFTKIANKFGVTVEQLQEANPDIKDINKIAVGDDIVIPAAVPDEVVDPSAEPSP